MQSQHPQVYIQKYSNEDIGPVDISEVWRYAGHKGTMLDSNLSETLQNAIDKSSAELNLKVAYTKMCKNYLNDISSDLHKILSECEDIYLFAATIGFWIDMQIEKFSKTDTPKSLIYHALGTERIEALCNKFCKDLQAKEAENDHELTKRFSPGYGNFPIDYQKAIFDILKCEKNIGISLNKSMLITPSKSVTAIAGIKNISKRPVPNDRKSGNKCDKCTKIDCEYRIN